MANADSDLPHLSSVLPISVVGLVRAPAPRPPLQPLQQAVFDPVASNSRWPVA
jgi:hypothetical protein